MDRIVECLPQDLQWSFGGKPTYRTGRYSASVDPTPCYAHDLKVVESTLSIVEDCVDILCKPTYYVLHHEPEERTNGWAQTYAKYPKPEDPEAPPYDGYVILAGKRIPPYPAVTRYLTAHEYGHHVEYDLLRRRGLDTHKKEVETEYAEFRGLPENPPCYGPGTWHANRAEVFANDFRIVVCEVEPEYWPHEVTHPWHSAQFRKRLEGWWEEHLS